LQIIRMTATYNQRWTPKSFRASILNPFFSAFAFSAIKRQRLSQHFQLFPRNYELCNFAKFILDFLKESSGLLGNAGLGGTGSALWK
jgi:hypothetical protein